MFNPKVISVNENLQANEEGCLSFPNLWLDVKRPVSIESEYFDRDGNKCIITLKGIDARCFLHELDHLNGIVFTQKVTPMAVLLAQKKQLNKRKRNGRTK
jgi:peptide deformylase